MIGFGVQIQVNREIWQIVFFFFIVSSLEKNQLVYTPLYREVLLVSSSHTTKNGGWTGHAIARQSQSLFAMEE